MIAVGVGRIIGTVYSLRVTPLHYNTGISICEDCIVTKRRSEVNLIDSHSCNMACERLHCCTHTRDSDSPVGLKFTSPINACSCWMQCVYLGSKRVLLILFRANIAKKTTTEWYTTKAQLKTELSRRNVSTKQNERNNYAHHNGSTSELHPGCTIYTRSVYIIKRLGSTSLQFPSNIHS